MDVAEVVLSSSFLPGLFLSFLPILFIISELLLGLYLKENIGHKSIWTSLSAHLSLSYISIIPQESFNVNRLFHICAILFSEEGSHISDSLNLLLIHLPGDLLDHSLGLSVLVVSHIRPTSWSSSWRWSRS